MATRIAPLLLLLLLVLALAAAVGGAQAPPTAGTSPAKNPPAPGSSSKPPAAKPAPKKPKPEDEAKAKLAASQRKANQVTGRGAKAPAPGAAKQPAVASAAKPAAPAKPSSAAAKQAEARKAGNPPAPPAARKANPVTGPGKPAAAAAPPKVAAMAQAAAAGDDPYADDPYAGARLADPTLGAWRPGRATFFGAPDAFARRYDATRGDGSFGVLEYGACGYTDLQRDGRTAEPSFPRSQYAAVADVSPEHQGGCGRCYEMRCKAADDPRGTVVLNNDGRPIALSTVGDAASHNQSVRYFEGDFGRPVLEDIDPTVRDSKGRPFPGNSASASNGVRVKCFPGAPTVRVRLADSCPCRQVLKAGDPTAKGDGEVRRQQWCCGGAGVSTLQDDRPLDLLTHFDLSYDAFEQLAHPVYGVQMIEFRPVDCDSGKPLPSRVPAGGGSTAPFIDRRKLYGPTGVRPGWIWFPYSKTRAELVRPGAFPAAPGSGKKAAAATCVELTRGGGLGFECRDCGGRAGLQPFSPDVYFPGGPSLRRDAISFWIKPDGGGGGAGAVPNLKVFLRNSNAGPDKGYCRTSVFTGQLPAAEERPGGWRRAVVPLSALQCDYPGATLAEVNRLEFQNEGEKPVPFCLADVGMA